VIEEDTRTAAAAAAAAEAAEQTCELCDYDCISMGTPPRMMLHAFRLHASLMTASSDIDGLVEPSSKTDHHLHEATLPKASAADLPSVIAPSTAVPSEAEDHVADSEAEDDDCESVQYLADFQTSHIPNLSCPFVFEAPDPFEIMFPQLVVSWMNWHGKCTFSHLTFICYTLSLVWPKDQFCGLSSIKMTLEAGARLCTTCKNECFELLNIFLSEVTMVVKRVSQEYLIIRTKLQTIERE
jgi:hypothetical protein